MTATASNVRATLLFTALAAALFAATPALAQDAPPPETVDTDASVPKDRLVGEYSAALFDGDDVAAGEAITALRAGGDVTITQQALNPDGTPQTDANGNPVLETVTLPNPNGPMGWGEVDHSLGIAQALVDSGQYANVEEALFLGTPQLNPDGTPVLDADGNPVYEGEGILAMRADGMGWGQIAKQLGFKSLGEIKSGRYADADPETEAGTASAAGDKAVKGRETANAAREKVHGKSGDHKPERTAKAERVTGRPEKTERIARVDRPERPERPVKPERGGRP